MQVGPELALRQEIPPPLSTHISLATCGFLWQHDFSCIRQLILSRFQLCASNSEDCGRAHCMLRPESQPPLSGKMASSPCPPKFGNPGHSKAWTAASVITVISLPSIALLPNTGLTTERPHGVPTKVIVKSTGARVQASFWKSPSDHSHKERGRPAMRLLFCSRRARWEKEGVNPHFDSVSVSPPPPKSSMMYVKCPSPTSLHTRDTFLFLTQLLGLMMTAGPYGPSHSAPSGSIKLIWSVFTPHFSDSLTQSHQELSFCGPVPPTRLPWE